MPAHQNHRRLARLLVHIARPMPGIGQRRRRRLRAQSVDGLWLISGRVHSEAATDPVAIPAEVIGRVHRSDELETSGETRRLLLRCARPPLAARRSRPSVCAHGRVRFELMAARRAVNHAKADGYAVAEVAAHQAVDKAKRALGERSSVCWKDGASDFNRQIAKKSPYALVCRVRRRGAD